MIRNSKEFKQLLRLRQRVRYKIIRFNDQINGLHVRYNFWYISLLYYAKNNVKQPNSKF